jgi:penicillin-binding protein 2
MKINLGFTRKHIGNYSFLNLSASNMLLDWIAVSSFRVCSIVILSSFFLVISANAQKEQPRSDKKGNPKNTVTKTTEKAKPAAKKTIPVQTRRISESTANPKLNVTNRFDETFRLETASNIAQDDFENEDLEVRRLAIDALGNHAGTVVVMEPNTGKILSMINQTWAFRRSFKPCSTIKLVTGIAGLKSNRIDNEGKIRNSFFPIDLTNSLAFSNNTYFQNLGASVGHTKMVATARELGFGETTGLNAEGEVTGKLPDFKFGSEIYRQYSHGDDFEVTALQLGVLVSTITNGGKLISPTIQKPGLEQTSSIKAYRREIAVKSEIFQRLIPGMIGAVNFGTAQNASNQYLNIVGKTGSCVDEGTWLGLFVSASSAVNPKLSVVVITKGSQERGSVAAEIAGKIYRGLRNRFSQSEMVAGSLQPIQKISVENSIAADVAQTPDSDELGYFSGVASSRKIRTANGVRNIEVNGQNEPTLRISGSSSIYNPPVEIDRNVIRPRIVNLSKKNKIN